jgi:hypothetical protein
MRGGSRSAGVDAMAGMDNQVTQRIRTAHAEWDDEIGARTVQLGDSKSAAARRRHFAPRDRGPLSSPGAGLGRD